MSVNQQMLSHKKSSNVLMLLLFSYTFVDWLVLNFLVEVLGS